MILFEGAFTNWSFGLWHKVFVSKGQPKLVTGFNSTKAVMMGINIPASQFRCAIRDVVDHFTDETMIL